MHGEGVAALMARLAIRDDSAPEVRHALESIARDEGRHAALAWEVLLWCRRSHPAEVEPAVADALLGLSRRPRKELWRGLRAGPWSDALGRWGLFVEAEPGALDRAHARRLATALARGARSAADLAPAT